MTETPKSKTYDPELRTQEFAKQIRIFIRKLRKDIPNFEDSKQLARSSGSIGANYIEANESLGKKDFLMRLRICRKEAKETIYWLNLIEGEDEKTSLSLIQEANELAAIFGSIISRA